MKYIDSEKLIATINNRIMSVNLEELGNFGCHRVWAYNNVKDICRSPQQKQPEVDLEKEMDRYFEELKEPEIISPYACRAIARHFYELGLKAGKEE